MSETLTPRELEQLVRRVFQPTDADRGLAVIVDLPDEKLADNEDWAARRRMAVQWVSALREVQSELGLERVVLAWYPNVGGNNADLPADCCPAVDDTAHDHADALAGAATLPFSELFATHSLHHSFLYTTQ